MNAPYARSNSVCLRAFQIPCTSSGGRGIYPQKSAIPLSHQRDLRKDQSTHHIRITPHKRIRRRALPPPSIAIIPNPTRNRPNSIRQKHHLFILPPQHRTTREMTTCFDAYHSAAGEDFYLLTVPEDLPCITTATGNISITGCVNPHNPLPILTGQIHRTVKRLRPD